MTFKEEIKVFWGNLKMACSTNWIVAKLDNYALELRKLHSCELPPNPKPPTTIPKPDITPPSQVSERK